MKFIEEAIEIDNQDYKATPQMIMYIDELIRKSTLTIERQEAIELEMPTLTSKRAEEIIIMLQQNQQPSLPQQLETKIILETEKENKK